MSTEIADVLVPAVAAIVGVAVGGTFGLLTQRSARKAAAEAWERERGERVQNRFREEQLDAVASFLTHAGDAHRYEMSRALRRGFPASEVRQPPTDTNAKSFGLMREAQSRLLLISRSADLRDASEELVRVIVNLIDLRGDEPEWGDKLTRFPADFQAAKHRVIGAARDELTT